MDPEAFDKILIKSIEGEIAARDFYRAASERLRDEGVKKIFARLAEDEEQHRVTLETFRFNPLARVEFEKAASDDFQVAEGEEIPDPSMEMTPRDAFQYAMKKEQEAMETYARLASRCQDAETRRLYEELSEMERGHKVELEELFVNAAYPEEW